MARTINVAEGIVPIGEFKTHASELIRRMHQDGRPIVITQHGRATAVLVPPGDYDASAEGEHIRKTIDRRLANSATAKWMTPEEARAKAKASLRRKLRER